MCSSITALGSIWTVKIVCALEVPYAAYSMDSVKTQDCFHSRYLCVSVTAMAGVDKYPLWMKSPLNCAYLGGTFSSVQNKCELLWTKTKIFNWAKWRVCGRKRKRCRHSLPLNYHANCLCRSQNQTKQTTSGLGSLPSMQGLLLQALELPDGASGNICAAVSQQSRHQLTNQPMEHTAGLTVLCEAGHTLTAAILCVNINSDLHGCRFSVVWVIQGNQTAMKTRHKFWSR